VKKAALLVLLCTVLCNAESSGWKWTRRALTVAGCVASAVDGWQSAKYLDGHHGLIEANGFLANSDGRIKVGRMVGFKAAFCAVPVVTGELPWHHNDLWPAATIVGGASTGVFTYISLHNQMLINKLAAHAR